MSYLSVSSGRGGGDGAGLMGKDRFIDGSCGALGGNVYWTFVRFLAG